MRLSKTIWCSKCNCERPFIKEKTFKKDGEWVKAGWRASVCYVCHERVYPPNKYKAVKVRSKLSGRLFDSKLEARREPALVAMENTGAICQLRYQVPYFLDVYSTQAVDELCSEVDDFAHEYPHMDELVTAIRRSRHRICKYVADFVYRDANGNEVVEDTKGRVTAEYRIKKKLMLACHGVEIIEPSDRGVQQKARGAGVHGAHTGSRLRGGR